jgi:hypothetical protein
MNINEGLNEFVGEILITGGMIGFMVPLAGFLQCLDHFELVPD